MDNKTLCLRLAEAETENDVIEQLKMAGLWDDPTCWQYFGDNEDNWSTIGNQQDTAQAALVEKLINSVDAMRSTNRRRGAALVGERAQRLEARCHPDRRGVYAAGRWSDGHASYPGRSARVPWS